MISRYDQQELQKVSAVSSLIMGSVAQYLQLFTELTIMILGWLSISLEVLIRKEFGERYLSIIRFFVAISVAGIFKLMVALFGGFSWLTWLFGWLVFIFFIRHRLRIMKRHKHRIIWHSMSFGISRFEWILNLARKFKVPIISQWNDWTLYRWIEPGYGFLLGAFLWPLDEGLAFYILVSTFCLFVKNQMVYYEQYNRFLDILDARIEAQYYQEAENGRPKQKTAGYSIVSFPTEMPLAAPVGQNAPDIAATVSETLGRNNASPLNLSPLKRNSQT